MSAIWVEQADIITLEARRLLDQVGLYLYKHGQYREAEGLQKRALTIN
jgi:hypothetical protein